MMAGARAAGFVKGRSKFEPTIPLSESVLAMRGFRLALGRKRMLRFPELARSRKESLLCTASRYI